MRAGVRLSLPCEHVWLRAAMPGLAPTLVAVLASLGYREVRWLPARGIAFTGVDGRRVQVVVVADVSPTEGGWPQAQVSPGRARSMGELCRTRLREDGRRARVRADYVALPGSGARMGWVPVTWAKGVAWAHDHGPDEPVLCATDKGK